MKTQEETMSLVTKLETCARRMLQRQGLRDQLTRRDEQIRQLNEASKEDKKAYERLKMAKYLDAMDDDARSTRAKLSRMIASVDKCIAILKNNE